MDNNQTETRQWHNPHETQPTTFRLVEIKRVMAPGKRPDIIKGRYSKPLNFWFNGYGGTISYASVKAWRECPPEQESTTECCLVWK